MSGSFLHFAAVSFRYDSSVEHLFYQLDLSFPAGWTGIVGPNGAGKSTLLSLAAGLLCPEDGAVRAPGPVAFCAQRTDHPPDGLADFLDASDSLGAELRGRLAVGVDWPRRWSTLSHGERKRAQIAVALWRDAPVLCLDEPTNHVDAEARGLLGAALARYRGIGLLVSHDRELLDTLCRQCVFLDPPHVVVRPGNWSAGRAQETQEEEGLRRRASRARQEVRAAAHRLAEVRAEAAVAKKRLSKRHIDKRDIDARSRIDGARLTGKDAVSARLARRLASGLQRAEARAAALSPRPARELGLWFTSEPARSDAVVSLPAGRLALGAPGTLDYPALVLGPRDRVALVGPNGSGKSTLVGRLLGATVLGAGRLLFVPQEISAEESAAMLTDLRALPRESRGRALTVIDLLGTEPERVLQTTEPSPGEVRKILIAMGIARAPSLIVLDEPTNHLDLPSIECLEEALRECRCALLLVSHDERFLAGLTTIRWEIGRGTRTSSRLLSVR